MNKFKFIFLLFLFFISFVYLNDVKKINILKLVENDKKISIVSTIANKNFKDPISFLDMDQKININLDINDIAKKVNKETDDKPIVYIYNTHQTEEYATNAYNITPSVVTASNILKDELEEFGIVSLIETKDVIKEVKKRGLDYPGTYEVSLDYLMQREKEYPSLKYFFDIHRDSVTGDNSRITIKGQKYAKVMFLVGANYETYEKTLKEVELMESFLEKNYPGIVRKKLVNYESGYNQRYRDNMYLIEIGGPDNSLEEIYNSSSAIAKAINYLIKEEK